MRAGNTQSRTALIMYFWTATIAFPVSISAFTPLWVAGCALAVMLVFTILFQRQRPEFHKAQNAEKVITA
jgi:UDP-GlcNAc:undecaprenyl-phosphate GlcNAc-1-phosphate transferase